MKNTIKLATLVLFFIAVSCKKTEKTDPNVIQKDTDSTEQKKESGVYNYVNCKTGLQYRIAPEGKIIGRFPYNTKLEILKKTGIPGFIEEEFDFFQGEWAGVRFKNDTVYVVDACLTNSYDVSFIKTANDYYLEPNQVLGKDLVFYQKDTAVVNNVAIDSTIMVEVTTQKDFESHYEASHQWEEIAKHEKKNGVITIKCNNQNSVRFKDKNKTYEYKGRFPSARTHLVSSIGPEGRECYFVDMTNCKQQKFNGTPLFNKDISLLFTINTNNQEYSEIVIHTLKDGNWIKQGLFTVKFKVSRSVFDVNNNLHLENYVEWNDGTYLKRSNQHFKLMIKGISKPEN